MAALGRSRLGHRDQFVHRGMGLGVMDPFRTTFRTVCGDLQLNQFEGDVYYLVDKRNNDQSVLSGAVARIGWGHGLIVAWQMIPPG